MELEQTLLTKKQKKTKEMMAEKDAAAAAASGAGKGEKGKACFVVQSFCVLVPVAG